MVWKDVLGYEGTYKVSNTGIVKSIDRTIKTINGKLVFKKGKVLKQYEDKYGYLVVGLRKSGSKPKTIKVHRIVATAFLSNVSEKLTVNHKDFNRKNNNVSNLEFCDIGKNVKYSHKNKRYPTNSKHGRSKLTETEVSQIREMYSKNTSPTLLSRKYKVSRSTIHRIVKFEIRKEPQTT